MDSCVLRDVADTVHTRVTLVPSHLQHGEVKDVRIVTHRSGTPKGIAYIEYEQEVRRDRDQCALQCFVSIVVQ